jgi:coenzyme F420-0:L-glutamate ligase / coenzyme F420-1:gamma-L-glutamate ligase
VRPEGGDLFGYGSREAVVAALAAVAGTQAIFGSPAASDELLHAVRRVLPGAEGRADVDSGTAGDTASAPDPDAGSLRLALPPGALREVVDALCFSHGWRVDVWQADEAGVMAHVSPRSP